MSDKSLDYRMLRGFTWLLGVACAVLWLMAMGAMSQRDDALKFRAHYGDVQLVCRAVKP